jgi:glutamine amidotransferase-like uncharacterized protein
MTNRKKIAVYETGEYSPTLFKKSMNEVILESGKDIDVVGITGDEIKNGALLHKDYIGLVMPGRNHGQDYRNEIEELGCAHIYLATYKNNLSIMAVCAGSYVLSTSVNWHNEFQPGAQKKVTNKFGLFDGTAIGALGDFWQDGYRGSTTDSINEVACPSILSAKVVDVTFENNQHNLKKGHSLYWGGGAFQPSAGSAQQITVLVRHADNAKVPDVTSSKNTRYFNFEKPPAVIEFAVGNGKTIFSNIHPEISGTRFYNLFNRTDLATNNKALFFKDQENLALSDHANKDLFHRFLNNCLESCAKPVAFCKKPLTRILANG